MKAKPLFIELLEHRRLLSASIEHGDAVLPNSHVVPGVVGTAPAGFTPAQIRRAYGFDRVVFGDGTIAGDGTGQTIAIIDAYNDPNIKSDLAVFNQTFSLPAMDGIKVAAHDTMRAVIDPLRKSEGVRRALRGLIYGRQANYYYGKEEKKAG